MNGDGEKFCLLCAHYDNEKRICKLKNERKDSLDSCDDYKKFEVRV